MKLGHQRYLQRRVSSKASIAKLLFSNGYKLFDNLGLTGEGDTTVSERRAATADEFEQLSERLAVIESLAQSDNRSRRQP